LEMATSDVKKYEVSLNRLPRLDALCANGLAETFNDIHVLDAVPKRYESEVQRKWNQNCFGNVWQEIGGLN